MKAFLIVLDSLGAGEAPDAADFGDLGAHTLKSAHRSPLFKADNLIRLGLGNVEGLGFLGSVDSPLADYGRMEELSKGKDTTIGHWEICGIVSEEPLPTYPGGFPAEVIDEFERRTGRGVICNKPYSGTAVIADYGREHIESGRLIVYTSADSVFQIAAHEDVVPVEELYRYCRIAREILVGKHGVGRVIARPFVGEHPFTRSAKRHDFSIEPPKPSLLDRLGDKKIRRVGVGKIGDIFAHSGLDEEIYTSSNAEGMALTERIADSDFDGFCFVNLVDFDMKFGHRRDADGYAGAIAEFDEWLGRFLPRLGEDDLLVITADHGCDPSFTASTDHTREYVPLLVYKKNGGGRPLGTLRGFFHAGDVIESHFAPQPRLNRRGL